MKAIINRVLVISLALAAAGLPVWSATSAQPALLKGEIETIAKPYRVGPGDVLSVHVYNQGDFNQPEILVAADGYASFNNVGPLLVGGKTVPEITEMLSQSIGALVKSPIITINLVRSRPGVIYIAGSVMRPGLVQMATDPKSLTAGGGGGGSSQQNGFRAELRLANALQTAGGVLPSADLSNVVLHRGETGEVINLNLWKLIKEGDVTQDAVLYPGDSVQIGELPEGNSISDEDFKTLVRSSIGPGTFPVRVLGYVGKPGVYGIDGVSPYLNSALSQANGFAVGANRKVVAIRRFNTTHSFSTMYVDPEKVDIALRPNDVIYVSERRVYATGRFFATVSNVFSPFTNAATAAGIVATSVK